MRERFTCRACETITQPPAPFHPIARGRAGPELLAMILEAKFGQHLPLNRQSDIYTREGVEIDVSTMADWVGACTATLAPLTALVEAHVMAAARIHGDDTTVPVLAKGKTTTGRLWAYVRDDQPFGGPEPPAAVFHYSRDRRGEHPNKHLAGYAGILQADAYAGFNDLYHPGRKPAETRSVCGWATDRGRLLGAWASQAVRPGPGRACAACRRSRAADRRDLRRRAQHQRPAGRAAARDTPKPFGAAGGRSRSLDARGTWQDVATCRGLQGEGLHAQALGHDQPVPG